MQGRGHNGPAMGLRLVLAQIDTTVGDLRGNAHLILDAYREALAAGAEMVVFPELALTGYPPEDLLLKPSFLEENTQQLAELAKAIDSAFAVVGYVASDGGPRNAAALLHEGRVVHSYYKCSLPNYGVFDEKRYFLAGTQCPVYDLGHCRIGISVCEDLWTYDGVPRIQAEAGAQMLINISASPYHARKVELREAILRTHARRFGIPVAYVNLVGGQDELVFDGGSMVVDSQGRLLARAPQFRSSLVVCDLPLEPAQPSGQSLLRSEEDGARKAFETLVPPQGRDMRALRALSAVRIEVRGTPPVGRAAEGKQIEPAEAPDLPTELRSGLRASGVAAAWRRPFLVEGRPLEELDALEEVYSALLLGLADYVRKNGFKGVVLGLSGGIDSALTATIAADSLGPAAVVGISMPSQYSSESSKQGARDLARNLGIGFHEIPINGIFERTLSDLQGLFRDLPPDVTEENIQARIRGMIVMAFSNKFGHLPLATGNKSEVAVGYCTLYGDMVGGFSVLKDVLKTQVYRLAKWRNSATPKNPPIPEDTLTRPPSAELRPDQKDTDSLPPYEVLDPILRGLIEDELAPRELVAQGFAREVVDRVFRMVQANEYKRRQAAPGIKITPRAFGRDRRYPLTNRYSPGSILRIEKDGLTGAERGDSE